MQGLQTRGQPLHSARMPCVSDTVPDCGGDDDELTPECAREQAIDELQRNAAWFADWLAKVCDTPAGWEPAELHDLTDDDAELQDFTEAQLCAVLSGASDEPAVRALHELRERFVKAHEADVARRTKELLREANGWAPE